MAAAALAALPVTAVTAVAPVPVTAAAAPAVVTAAAQVLARGLALDDPTGTSDSLPRSSTSRISTWIFSPT